MAALSDLLAAANARTNLTRIQPGDDFWLRHVADSLAAGLALPALRDSGWRVLDLGCGAGFPALVLAAAWPRLQVAALDSNHRKIEFVKAAIAALKLDNCTALAARGREFAARPENHDAFDLVACRAVGDAADLCRETHRLLRPGGIILLYKTATATADELRLAATRSPAKLYAWSVANPALPQELGSHAFLVGKKPA
jgi:16S rRNA (guanine527-N7)-methyltransferase